MNRQNSQKQDNYVDNVHYESDGEDVGGKKGTKAGNGAGGPTYLLKDPKKANKNRKSSAASLAEPLDQSKQSAEKYGRIGNVHYK